jgi:hypothetical protein
MVKYGIALPLNGLAQVSRRQGRLLKQTWVNYGYELQEWSEVVRDPPKSINIKGREFEPRFPLISFQTDKIFIP